jgi:hypothetical protein
VWEIALRDSVVLSAVQAVLPMILHILPPILIVKIVHISYVIRDYLSECFGAVMFFEVRL